MKTWCKVVTISIFLISEGYAQNYGWVKVARLDSVYGLTTVEFVDSLHGWAAAGSGQVYRTTDGGSRWTAYATGAPFVVYSISMLDSLNGWGAGNDGTTGDVIHTTDGGKTWAWQYEKFECQYFGTHAFSKSRNITSGKTHYSSGPDTGKIVQTTDGGATWIERTIADSLRGFGKVVFIDSLHGWIIGEYGSSLLRTIDGDATWQVLPYRPEIHIATFIDTLRGWGGYDDYLYKTTDGGVSWQFQTYIRDTIDPHVGPEVYVNALSFLDSLNGWAFAGIFYYGIISEGIYRTTDGGLTWARESAGLTSDFGVAMDGKMLDRYHGLAVCGDGSVLRYQVITAVVEKLPETPGRSSLFQNYPNPFNPTTIIEYEIAKSTNVSIKIYDINGREVKDVVNSVHEAGVFRIKFDAGELASGIYYYTIQAGQYSETKQMTLVK